MRWDRQHPLIVDRPRLVLVADEAEAIRGRGASITGPVAVVDGFVARLAADGVRTLGSQRLGGTRQTSVFGLLDATVQAEARGLGLEIGSVPLQDLFVHLTSQESAS